MIFFARSGESFASPAMIASRSGFMDVRIRWHEGILWHVRSGVVGGALPVVHFARFADRASRTGGGAFAALVALVAEVRVNDRRWFDLRIGEDETEALEGTEIIGQHLSGESAFTESAKHRRFVEIELVLRRFPAVDFRIIDLRLGVIFALHDDLIAFLGERLESGILQRAAGAEHRHRHYGFLERFDAGGGVLVVGRTLFHAAVRTAQDAERRADDGFRAGKDFTDIRMGKTVNTAEADEIGTATFKNIFQIGFKLAHFNTPFAFRCL